MGLQDAFMISGPVSNASIFDFFCMQILTTETKRVKLLLMVGYVQACPATPKLA